MKTSSRLSATAILSAATRDPSVDATQMGEVASLVASGDLRGAHRVLTRNARTTLAKADNPGISTTTPTPTTEQRLKRLKRRLADAEQRLERLAPTAPTNSKPKKPLNAQQLLAAIDRHVTDPAQAGHLASLVQQGQLEEASRSLRLARRQRELEQQGL